MDKLDNIVEETLTFYEREKIMGNYVHLDRILDMNMEELGEMIGEKAKTLYKTIHLVMNLMKMKSERLEKSITIKSSEDVLEYLQYTIIPVTLYYEEFWTVYLNRANKIITTEKISQGGYSGTVADPKIIIGNAIKHKASGMILCHNHPSGNRQPSDADRQITSKIVQAASFFDISVLDHIILTGNEHFSFQDEGMI